MKERPIGGEPGLRIASALREALAEGYSAGSLRADILAGIVVGIVALPLSMALAIASGMAPQHGLYTAIIAGGIIPILGGSRCQVSGPTAAFVVILAPISAQYGAGGLLVATMLAGALMIGMGLLRLGRLIEFIPYPVTTGFTTGIALVIATLQVKDFLGLTIEKMPEHYLQRVAALVSHFSTLNISDAAIGALTLAVLIVWPRLTRKAPGPLIALPLAGVVAVLCSRWIEGFEVSTIASRFSYVRDGATFAGVPNVAPAFQWPWTFPNAQGQPVGLSWELLRQLVGPAFAIAMLGAIESLLSAVVADGITGHRHDPDAELFAQGVGNVAAPFFGGFAATGALARTATNVRSGARSPIAAITHAVFMLMAVVLLAPLLGYLPMASMAALLLIVAWNMSELKHFGHTLRVAPRSDVFVLLTCFLLTVIFDMVIAVSVGVVLAALLFMRRMAELSDVRLVSGRHPALVEPLPPGVILYEIDGPLFFGAAQKAMSELRIIGADVRAVILDITDVPTIDATGLVNLESAIDRLHKQGVYVLIAGAQRQPLRLFARAGWRHKTDRLTVKRTLERAVAEARAWIAALPPRPASRITPRPA